MPRRNDEIKERMREMLKSLKAMYGLESKGRKENSIVAYQKQNQNVLTAFTTAFTHSSSLVQKALIEYAKV